MVPVLIQTTKAAYNTSRPMDSWRVKWRVEDPATYYFTVAGDETVAERRLAQRVNNSLREEFGKRPVQEVVSGDRSQIMSMVRETTDQQAREIGR